MLESAAVSHLQLRCLENCKIHSLFLLSYVGCFGSKGWTSRSSVFKEQVLVKPLSLMSGTFHLVCVLFISGKTTLLWSLTDGGKRPQDDTIPTVWLNTSQVTKGKPHTVYPLYMCAC